MILEQRHLLTEQEVDKEFLGKLVLLDRTTIFPPDTGGYVVVYGDNEDDYTKLLELGRSLCGDRIMLQAGLKVREKLILGYNITLMQTLHRLSVI
jgi:hypothetical protein